MNSQNAHRPGYKYTPLGWIPENWEVTSLGEVGKIKMCKRIFNNETSEKGEIPFYKIGTFGREPDSYIGKELYERYRSKYSFPKKGDILISASGTLGRTVVYDGCPAYFQDSNIVWLDCDKSKISNEYLLHVYSIIKYDSEGGTIQRLYNNIITSAKFPQPPLPEQFQIATVLSTWDDAIKKTQQLIARIHQRNKGLVHQLLRGKRRIEGFSKDWIEVHLGDAFIEREEIRNADLSLLSVGAQGVYPQSQSEKRDVSNSDKSKYKRICPGDIGYNTMRMWQGRSALSSLEGIVSPAYTVVTPKKGQYSPFYAYLFKLPVVVHKFFRHSQGLVEDTLNCKYRDFSKVRVLTPDYDEQVAIAALLDTTQREIQLYQAKLEALQQQKRGLMQKLLTGEIRVKITA